MPHSATAAATENKADEPTGGIADSAPLSPDGSGILQNEDLLRLVRTTKGANQVVSSFAENVLGHSNWGVLLSAAPNALGRLGQCFVLASDPLAGSLVFPNPDTIGLKYPSLRPNLIECAHLGRDAFNEAEECMKSVSMLAGGVCELGGNIDLIVEAVEDPDLAELDLPDQLAKLREVSATSVKDVKAVKKKFGAWAEFVRAIHKACVAKDDQLERNKIELHDEITVQEMTKQKKQEMMDKAKVEKEEYRRQRDDKQQEFNKAQKSLDRGKWIDLTRGAASIVTTTAKIYSDPLSSLINFLSKGFNSQGQKTIDIPAFAPDPKDSLHHRDPGYALAQGLQECLYRLQAALVSQNGVMEYYGVDWEGLSGHAQTERNITYIWNGFQGMTAQFAKEHTPIAKQVRVVVRPGEKVAAIIREIVRSERNVQQDTSALLSRNADVWRNDVKGSLEAVTAIIDQGYLEVDREEAQKEKLRAEQISARKPSSAELRFRRLQHAQRALCDAEKRLRRHMEAEMKEAEDFTLMELRLEKMLMEKANMAQVKEILGDCVEQLQYFCENLDELVKFFASMQTMITYMDQTRVQQFSQKAITTRKLADRYKASAADATKDEQQSRERKEKERLERLRLQALELKGHYIVVQAMADTYAEASGLYILPGIKTIERLALPDAKRMTNDERAMQISEVGKMARKAKENVSSLASKRRKQVWAAITEERGAIEDAED
ncbi:hypothetical protein F5Y19DRAFT_487389 [Xylariaceae sp. FL1651]|nr:hypothetical protein F5Y19DRAFT_487389 [Xylariaceae sp. FL1651]